MVVQPTQVNVDSGRSTGRRWPAEWEPQQAIWFAWPHQKRTWPNRFDGIPTAFSKFVNAVGQFIAVNVLVPTGRADDARRLLSADANLFEAATNDCWIRDYGPTFVLDDNDLVAVDWRFNAWGGKYPPWDDDDAAAKSISKSIGVRRERSPLTLEGGAIEGDGTGRLLTTPICIETATRNRGWSRDRISRELHRRLGVTEIVWIDGGGMLGDDTDGHIDQLARFVTPTDVVVAVSGSTDDENSVPLGRNRKQLESWAEQTSPQVTVHPLPTPPPRSIDGTRMPESYCNFLMIGDRAIIVPTFGHAKSDRKAITLLKSLRPHTEVIGVDASEFILGRGAWHCASQQQPVAPGPR